MLQYLQSRYYIKVTDIPVKYKIDTGKFPDPIKNAIEKPIFETAWERFQKDFREGKFLDDSLELVYTTLL